jgi:hypothetical protein
VYLDIYVARKYYILVPTIYHLIPKRDHGLALYIAILEFHSYIVHSGIKSALCGCIICFRLSSCSFAIIIILVSDCCLTPTQQFSVISSRAQVYF